MSPFYRFYHFLFRLMLRLFTRRAVVTGLENLPASGPAILVSNHISYWDPGLLVALVPRQIYFLSKAEMFDGGIVDWLFRKADVFPIQRGSADVEAMRHALGVLARGDLVGMFPKGTRAPENRDQPVRGGMVLLAARSKAPLVPIGIAGMDGLLGPKFPWLGWPRVTITFGRPFMLDEIFPAAITADNRPAVVEAIMARVQALLPSPASAG